MDDSERVVAILAADSGESRWGLIAFLARCDSKKTEAFIAWSTFLGNDSGSIYESWKYVTVRIGKSKAQRHRWNVSTDKRATFAPRPSIKLLKEMAGADSFVAQVTPYSAVPITAVFDTKGMVAAFAPLAKACGWSFGGKSPSVPGGQWVTK